MDTEALKEFLSLLMGLLPVSHTHGALSSDQAVEHHLVLVGDTLHVFFLGAAVEADYFARSWSRDTLRYEI